MSSLLPELYNGTGEVWGVCDAVVGVAVLCVPAISTSLPRQILKFKENAHKQTHTGSFIWSTLPLPILSSCQAAKTTILIRDTEISWFSQSSECFIAKCIYQYLV